MSSLFTSRATGGRPVPGRGVSRLAGRCLLRVCARRRSIATRLASLDARAPGYAVEGLAARSLGECIGLGSGLGAGVRPVGCSRLGIAGSAATCGMPASPRRACSACAVVLVVGPVPPWRCVWVSVGGLARCVTGSMPDSRVEGRVAVLWWWRSVAWRFRALASGSSCLGRGGLRGDTGFRNGIGSSSCFGGTTEPGAFKRRFCPRPVDILLSL